MSSLRDRADCEPHVLQGIGTVVQVEANEERRIRRIRSWLQMSK
jgi:hypothetical protein